MLSRGWGHSREGGIEERGRLADGEPSTRTGKDVERRYVVLRADHESPDTEIGFREQDNRSGAGDFGSGSTSGCG